MSERDDFEDDSADICSVCNGQSGGRAIGVACVPGQPYSVLWCDSCLRNNAIPVISAEINWYDVEFNLDNMADWAKSFTVWHDGKYMPFPEWAKTVDNEAIRKRFSNE